MGRDGREHWEGNWYVLMGLELLMSEQQCVYFLKLTLYDIVRTEQSEGHFFFFFSKVFYYLKATDDHESLAMGYV